MAGIAPSVGDDGFVQEPHTLSAILNCLPKEVKTLGPRKQTVIHTCFDVSDQYLALGSEQGYVWNLDLYATKLTREFNDFKGTAITAVKLNIPHGYIAYGTRDGHTKIESFTKQLSKKYRIQEKDNQAIAALQWNSLGTHLFCGYTSGKLILIKVSLQSARDQMEVIPLLECGSPVVQLSVSGHNLLISTVARSLMMDVESGRVTQVGTKERKPGPFGGAFSQPSPPEEGAAPQAHLARPGLRVWTADDSGRVVLTTKFRDPLSSAHLPRVPTHSWAAPTPQFSESWQFSLILPWLASFIVSHHEHTLWVLDPKTSEVAAVLCLEHSITSVVTHGKFIYVLCAGMARPLARFTAHSSYLKSIKESKPSIQVEGMTVEYVVEGGEEGGWKNSGGSTTTSEGNGTRRREEETEEGMIKEAVSSQSTPEEAERGAKEITEHAATPSPPSGRYDSEHTEGVAQPVTSSGAHPTEHRVGSDAQGTVLTEPAGSPPTAKQALKMTGSGESEEGGPKFEITAGGFPNEPSPDASIDRELGSGSRTSLEEAVETASPTVPDPNQLYSHPPMTSTSAQSSDHSSHRIPEPISDLERAHHPGRHQHGIGPEIGREVVDLLRPTLGKLSGLIRHHERDKEKDSPSSSPSLTPRGVGVPVTPMDSEEKERRLRMAQTAAGEDSISERVTHKKRRKRKTKKLSSRSSSASTSLERLTDIGELEDLTPSSPYNEVVDSPQAELVSDGPKDETQAEELVQLRSKLEALVETEELSHSLGKPGMEPELPTGSRDEVECSPVPVVTVAPAQEEKQDEVHEREEEEQPPHVTPVDTHLEPSQTPSGHSAMENSVPTEAEEVSKTPDNSAVEPDTSEPTEEKVVSWSPMWEESPAARGEQKRLLDIAEVAKGKDPLSQMQTDEESLFQMMEEADSSTSPTLLDVDLRLSPTTSAKIGEKTGSSEESHLFNIDEIPSELSDNPLYGDDTSDITTDTESSQQFGRQGPHARPQFLSRRSAPPSSVFAVKHVNTKGAASVGASRAGSDMSWDFLEPRQRSNEPFRPPLFDDSGSPVSFSHSLQPSPFDQPHQHPLNKATSLPPQTDLWRSRDDSGSDFSYEDNEPCLEPEEFNLCTPVEDSRAKSLEMQGACKMSPTPLPAHNRPESAESFYEESPQEESLPESDIWVTVPHPCHGHIQNVCLSDQLLWLVDSRNMVYCTSVNSKGRKWELIKRPMNQVTSSPSGHIVWGLYRQNAYIRLGLGLSVVGETWKNITKTTSLAQKIKYVCADETGVWAVKTDGQIIFRKGVSESLPQGRVWVEVGRAASFTSVASCSGVVWAVNSTGRLFYREGVTVQKPSGNKWVDMKAPRMMVACITQGSMAWIIDQEGKMGFRCGIKPSQPTGKNPWWEVSISTTLPHSSLPLHSLWQVMTSEGSQFLSSVSSLITTHLPGHHKLIAVSASNQAGVCVLETGSKVHACWCSTTGYHYGPACRDGVFQLTTWTMFGIGGTGMWVIRDDGELYCVTPNEKLIRIECAATVQMMAVSPTALWVVANNQLWSRQGMTSDVPEGISWDYIELSTQLHERKLKHVVCGKRAVWAIDSTGIPHFRFGVHAREPGTGMSPAWVPVEDVPHRLLQIAVNNEDWLVWACDENFNVYARTGVTQDFPVGEAWVTVPGQQVKELCASCNKIYALTPTGNLYCRYGISEDNVEGNYWRQMPGDFVHIAVGPGGQLWTLDSKGAILKQQLKSITVCQNSEFLRHKFEEVLDQSWEVV